MAETIEEYKRDNANLQRKLDVALQKVALYENESLEKEGYYAYKSFVKQQVDIIKEFKLKDEITKSPKDDKFYDRVNAIGDGIKKAISDLSLLKTELKISAEDEKKNSYFSRNTTPESVADSIGNTAGKNM